MFKRKKLKSYIVADNKKISLAFEHGGHKYYQFENAFELTTGRGLQALVVYDEFRMRCDREYLEKHCKAVQVILDDPKKITITTIALLNNNLKERLALAPFPDHIYKLASVIFFDESESPFSYDFAYNVKKIAGWRADEEMLPFLVTQPLKALMPFSGIAKESLKTYLKVADVIEKSTQEAMSQVLSRPESKTAT